MSRNRDGGSQGLPSLTYDEYEDWYELVYLRENGRHQTWQKWERWVITRMDSTYINGEQLVGVTQDELLEAHYRGWLADPDKCQAAETLKMFFETLPTEYEVALAVLGEEYFA